MATPSKPRATRNSRQAQSTSLLHHCRSTHISTSGTTLASTLFSCCYVWLTRLQLLRHMRSKSFRRTKFLAMHPRMPKSQAYKHPCAKLTTLQGIRKSDDTIQTAMVPFHSSPRPFCWRATSIPPRKDELQARDKHPLPVEISFVE